MDESGRMDGASCLENEGYLIDGNMRCLSWAAEQVCLRSRVIQEDTEDITNAKSLKIGGLDISFVKDTDIACAGLAVCECPGMNVVYEVYQVVTITQPYVAGFLSFREKDPLLALVNRYREETGETLDLLMVDGNGLLHPRRFGLACHVGVEADLPTIGIAKNEHRMSDVRSELIADSGAVGPTHRLISEDGCLLGFALKTTAASKNPVFVSVGHKISLQTAVALVLRCCRRRIPEPVRQADIRTRRLLKDLEGKENHSRSTKGH